ncbi:uncharacterized protein [Palaemon carinicauda]|uniref:uncharacterized protein n=1 Tax=Palaemon carinicauda TaxID=392227 RepID=UPI0035B5993B
MKDYTAGSTITGSTPLGTRYKEHLVDGIHSYGKFTDCSATFHYWDDWYLIDLGSMRTIREIKFLIENYSTTIYLKDYKFRIGDHPVPGGDFSSYTQFAFYSEPLGPDKFIVLTRDPPIIGRYVSIQRWSDRSICNPAGGTINVKCHINICHLEIR